MAISSVVRARLGTYNKDDTCAICMNHLNPKLERRLGCIVIHDNADGAKHPMHADCIKQYFANSNFHQNIGPCPHCRARISLPSENTKLDMAVEALILSVINGAAHATLTYLTGMPLLVALAPSVISSILSLDCLRAEHKELGLQRSVTTEIALNVLQSSAFIGTSLFASIYASCITQALIPNSLITGIIGTTASIPFMPRFYKSL